MANLETLLVNVKNALQDTSYSDDFIIEKFNQGLELCAAYTILPDLESSGLVITDPLVTEVDIPVGWNYHSNLYSAHVKDARDIAVVSSVGLLQEDHPEFDDSDPTNGEIETLTTRKDSIVYFPTPSVATEVVCGFYVNPTPLADNGDIPTCIPVALHEELLENFALWKCWNMIEDGIEGIKLNTAHHRKAFNTALMELDDLIDSGQSQPSPKRTSGWI